MNKIQLNQTENSDISPKVRAEADDFRDFDETPQKFRAFPP